MKIPDYAINVKNAVGGSYRVLLIGSSATDNKHRSFGFRFLLLNRYKPEDNKSSSKQIIHYRSPSIRGNEAIFVGLLSLLRKWNSLAK